MKVSFTIPGQPVPKGRPRMTKTGTTFTPKRTREYERHAKMMATIAMKGAEPVRDGVQMSLRLMFGDKRRRDIDNAAKAILDALNGVVYADDSQIFRLEVERGYDKQNPRAEVEVSCG